MSSSAYYPCNHASLDIHKHTHTYTHRYTNTQIVLDMIINSMFLVCWNPYFGNPYCSLIRDYSITRFDQNQAACDGSNKTFFSYNVLAWVNIYVFGYADYENQYEKE